MDRFKLEYEMKVRGVTVSKLCKDLHISRTAFYRKCRGMSEFTREEMQRIIDYLTLENAMEIFFPQKVSYTTPA